MADITGKLTEGSDSVIDASDVNEMGFGYPRYFHGGRSVYTVISPRAKGLTIGVNLNPDRYCNFDCVYCEVHGPKPETPSPCDVEAASLELERLLSLSLSGLLGQMECYRTVPNELLALQEVTLSGDGEPTLCPNFSEVVGAVIRLRALGRFPFFKIVLVTNASGLLLPEVSAGLRMLTSRDEIWAKLDAGTQRWMNQINHPQIDIEEILKNIRTVGTQRDIVIQTLFPLLQKSPPPAAEVEAYIHRLQTLKTQGTRISQVQIYSAHRPTTHAGCDHLPLRTLSQIARQVREETNLHVEVY